ncbi:cysteine repeat modular protein 2 [Plasmodium gonderi]|uniref:Cysteine repeat modular protein 2 n=1 Tax=Plasmodium gonderi TaxID=77519 RepID=A0A1Y1JF06_PLAGO|nr:cysteine repeat modular protein 2 [Plasmodium gonderi]GAW79322.1 cysteine repeat modular protein 2 [Plasmodium gonderi]
MVNPSKFFFFSSVLITYLLKNKAEANGKAEYGKNPRVVPSMKINNNPQVSKSTTVKLDNSKFKRTHKNILKARKRGINFVALNLQNILELKSNDPLSRINNIYSRKKENFLSACYEHGKIKNASACNRITATKQICDMPLDFNLNYVFSVKENNDLLSKCLVDNIPEHRIRNNNHAIVESEDFFDLKILNETVLLRNSIIITEDACTNKIKVRSPYFTFESSPNPFGSPILYKGEVIGTEFKNIKVEKNVEGLFNVCSCQVDNVYKNYNNCELANKHYTHIYTLRVIMKPTHIINVSTGEKLDITFKEYYTPFPIKMAFIIDMISGYNCNNINDKSFAQVQEDFYKNKKKINFYDIFLYEIAPNEINEDIVFENPGKYLLCYTSSDNGTVFSALLANIHVDGYNLREVKYLYADLHSVKLNLGHFVILERKGLKEPFEVVFKRKEEKKCSGETVIQSNIISNFWQDEDEEVAMYAIHVLNEKLNEYNELLDICAKEHDEYSLIGHAKVKPYILHTYRDISYLYNFNVVPEDVRTYVIQKESSFFKFYPYMLEHIEDHNIDELYISFLCYPTKNEIVATYNFDKNMTPTYFAHFKISHASGSILYISDDELKLYVLKKNSQSLFVYDINPENVMTKVEAIDKPVDDLFMNNLLAYFWDYADFEKCENCFSPIMMEPLYDENKNVQLIFLVTSDPDHKLVIIDLKFHPVYVHDSNAVKDTFAEIDALKFSLDVLKDSSYLITNISCGILKNESFDCFLIDQMNNSVIAVQYVKKQNVLILIDTFQGEGKSDIKDENVHFHDFVFSQFNTYLQRPKNVVPFPYEDSYILFIDEDESNEINLIVYRKNKPNNNFSYISKINNTYIDDGKVHKIYKFYDHKELFNRNALLIVKEHEGNVELVYGPIRNISNMTELKYNYPYIIQDNGIPYVLKIKSNEIKKIKLLHNFEIVVHNVNKSQYVTIDKYDGTINIKLSEFIGDPVNLSVKVYGVFIELKIDISFNVICADGMKALNGNCIPCPVDSYNNINEYTKNKNIYECSKCRENSITKSEASTSMAQCLCLPGYELKSNGICVPCAVGTWKSELSNSPCIFHCYPNSYSLVRGSRSEEESECKCLKGYYFVSKDGVNFCEQCDIGYFCPGEYKGNQKKCPENTTNVKQQNFSIKSCKCDIGFEPFDSSNLNDYDFRKNPIFDDYKDFEKEIKGSQVCVPCKIGSYKDTVSENNCKSCSAHVFTDATKSTSISECKKCEKGYYLHAQDSCLLCPDNHYCPGSNIEDPKYTIYENQKVPCDSKSLTKPPNELNVSHLSCLCKKGFEYIKAEDNEFDCLEVPKNYYKSNLSNTEKIPCPENSITLYTQTQSKIKCICIEGHYWDINEKKCIKCPKGYYCPGGHLKNCFLKDTLHLCIPKKIKCPIKNTTTKAEGSLSESSCLCDKGYTLSKEVLRECVLCPVNTYKDVVSNAECTMCLTPYTTDGQMGSAKEEDCTCSGGYYFFNHCLPCSDKNTYCKGGKMIVNNKSKTIHYAPSKCPPNTVVSFETERPYNQSFCVCKKGYKHVYTANNYTKICAPCEPGFFKTVIGDFSCESKCKPNSTSLIGTTHETHCFCLKNYYFKYGICVNCPDGAYCEGGFHEETLLSMKKNETSLDHSKIKHVMPVPKENYALYKLKTNIYNMDWFIVECPIKEACLYNEKCHESMTNFLCGECKKGYTNNFSKLNLCIKCSGNITNVLHIIFVSIFILLFTVIMAYLNVFTGDNRKSVHSIVIKIAVNYFSCMKIFYVVGTSELYFPSNFSSHINYIIQNIKRLLKAKKNSGLYCILTSYFDISHSDAYFYGMLFYAFRPILLAITLTILVYLMVEIYKFKVRDETRIKLNVIDKIKELGKTELYEEIMKELASERALVLFRYIPIPGDSKFKRIRNFLEDMIPMYVTLLFFIHTKTTHFMLTLLDCKGIYYNDKFVEHYMSYVPSVKCDLSRTYAKFFILGMGGIVVWGIGIPLMSYLVLYKNRKHLHSENILFKYGFLNNGFNFQFWYWESIFFLRKILILLISSVPVFKTARIFGTTMWLFTVISFFFLTVQMILQPFDSRNYHILNKFETYSMFTWTMTLMIFVFLTVSNANAAINFYVLLFLLFFNFIFVARVLMALCYSYIENLRHIKKHVKIPFLSKFFEKMSKIAEEKYYKEPMVSLNTRDNSVEFMKKYKRYPLRKYRLLTNEEKDYFLNVLSNFIYFGVSNLNFTVFHSYFMEFVLRLSVINNEILHKKEKIGILKLIAKDPQNINEWIKIKESELSKRTFFERHKKILNLFTKNMFIIQNNIKRIIYKGDKHTIVSDYEVLINVLKYDEDFITDFKFLYDESTVKSGLTLSDLQLSFTKIKMKDKKLIMQLFSLFIAKKNIVQFERDIHLKNKIEQLKSLYDMLIKSNEKKEITFRKNFENAVKADPMDYRTLQNELEILNDRINNLIDSYQRLTDASHNESNSNDDIIIKNDSEFFDNNLKELSFKELTSDDEQKMGNTEEGDIMQNDENTENLNCIDEEKKNKMEEE